MTNLSRNKTGGATYEKVYGSLDSPRNSECEIRGKTSEYSPVYLCDEEEFKQMVGTEEEKIKCQ